MLDTVYLHFLQLSYGNCKMCATREISSTVSASIFDSCAMNLTTSVFALKACKIRKNRNLVFLYTVPSEAHKCGAAIVGKDTNKSIKLGPHSLNSKKYS